MRLLDKYYEIKNGLKSLWYWKGVIWRNRAWDYCYIFKLLDHQFAQMEKCIREGYNVKANDIADKIKLARLALKRLEQDDYILQEDPIFRKNKKYKARFGHYYYDSYMRQQDLDYVLKLMSKYLFYWWE